jgi:hypothetical protein
VPYLALQESIRSGGMVHELAKSTSKRLLFYCAFGERSAMAVQDAGSHGGLPHRGRRRRLEESQRAAGGS